MEKLKTIEKIIIALSLSLLIIILTWVIVFFRHDSLEQTPFIISTLIVFTILFVSILRYSSLLRLIVENKINETEAENRQKREIKWRELIESKEIPSQTSIDELNKKIETFMNSFTPKNEYKNDELIKLQNNFIALYIASLPKEQLNYDFIVKILKGEDNGIKEIKQIIDKAQ